MYERFFKRLIDIIISLLCLPFFLIISVVVIPLIYFSDRGNPFYNAERLGKNRKVFKMYKFRTMRVNAEDIRNEDGSTFNSENDPRLTKIGKVLRKLSIDELPQILNVLIGNMSIIGPRPDLPEHFKEYTEEEKKKLNVLPGLTGYNQAYFRNTIPWKQRLINDVYYSENIGLLLDLKIFFKTIQVVLKREGVFNE